MLEFVIKRNDQEPALTVEVTDENGAPIDLTGATAKFFMKDPRSTLKVNGAAATITDAANGKAQYAWAPGDTDTDGEFYGEFEFTLASGRRLTAPSDGYIRIVVRPDLG